LEIHHIDVGQGDGALIISPGGDVAMIDDGANCSNVVSYLQSHGVSTIDYHFASHYHADHIGCLDNMVAAGVSIGTACYDRGGSYDTAAFTNYVNACGAKRQTTTKGQVVNLAGGVSITTVDLDGAGVSTSDENSLSLVLKVSYGSFDGVFGGDLTGLSPQDDIESVVGPEVGDVEVYKVNHHGSAYSSNDTWLNATTPEVGIISVGNNNYGHPTADALTRLHNHAVETYWTGVGEGATPDPAYDHVVGDIVIIAVGSGYTVNGVSYASQ